MGSFSMILLLTFLSAWPEVASHNNDALDKLADRALQEWCLRMDLDKTTLGKVEIMLGSSGVQCGPKVPLVPMVPISSLPRPQKAAQIRMVREMTQERFINNKRPFRSDNGTRDEEFDLGISKDLKPPPNPYIDVALTIPPQDMLAEFAKEAPPRVVAATLNTILKLVGSVAATTAVESINVLTAERAANLIFQMLLTGYMYKNAEYRISLSERLRNMEIPDSQAPHFLPKIEGKIKVGIGGEKVEVDAEAYMAELRKEVQAARKEMVETKKRKREVLEKDLLTYIASVPDMNIEEVQKEMSQEVLDSMKTIVGSTVNSISKGPGGLSIRNDLDPGTKLKYFMYLLSGGEKLVRLRSTELSQVCFWQMVIGWKIREIEMMKEVNQTMHPGP